ncbi:Transpos_assoc domain-containing protein [Cephalotus follicularis]|uniref:Transpos_assoc domain-containing protein n=1 Tax=Cephalotus follicularis TaxID=3775 RepID=A0A1Q3AX37_CEPFO|nr:Transpos_assoc domain-containing protein [Cephalotus follicularis]
MSMDKSWMRRRVVRGLLTEEFNRGVLGFLDFAFSNGEFVWNSKIKCPCNRCKLRAFGTRSDVRLHLLKNGFMLHYTLWDQHGEKRELRRAAVEQLHPSGPSNPFGDIVMERQLKIGKAKGKKIDDVYYDTNRRVKEDTLQPPTVVEKVKKYKVASGSDTVKGPFNVVALTEATGGTQKGKIRGLGNYMTSAKMLPQALRTPSVMGNQSHPFTSQPPYAGPGMDAGYREITDLQQQMSRIETMLQALIQMASAHMASHSGRSRSDQSMSQNQHYPSQSSPNSDHSDSQS